MPEYLAPGVYIEEISLGSQPIEGVSTSTAGFVAVSGRGPLLGPLTSFREFAQAATPNLDVNLPLAVRGFFENGGQRCFVSQIAADDPLESGLGALDGQTVSVVCCPDDAKVANAAATMAKHCETHKDRFCILQASQPVVPVATHRPPAQSSYAAYYHPWLTVASLDGSSAMTIPPCGHVAGVYAKMDLERGVWKAPAGVGLTGAAGLSQEFNDAENEVLNSAGVNAIRNFAGRGIAVWGGRTTASGSDFEWKYVNVRRLLIFIEHSIDLGTQWAVFGPNGAALWMAVRKTIDNFLAGLWRAGGLQGSTQEEAFLVRCDQTTMTQNDIDSGRLICLVGVAPVKPAEFVIFRIIIQTQC